MDRELDILIGKKIFGYIVIVEKDKYRWIDRKNKIKGILPSYSTVIDHAYIIVNHLQYNGYICKHGQYFDEKENSIYKCIFENENKKKKVVAESDTLEKSICDAALKLYE